MPLFEDINTRNDLALFLGLPPQKLTYLLYIKGVDNCYSTFEIPKKSGGVRTIHAPNTELMKILRVLASELATYQQQIWEKIILHQIYLMDLQRTNLLLQMPKYILKRNMY